jgi:hypothetical protein
VLQHKEDAVELAKGARTNTKHSQRQKIAVLQVR